MINKWHFLLLAFLLFSFKGNEPRLVHLLPGSEADPCNTSNVAFEGGEEIIYKLYYNWNFVWLPAGEVTFRVVETKDEFQISATGITYKSYEWFFKVRDYYSSVVDKETLLPKVFIRDIHEGNYTWYNKVDFDQKNRKAVSVQGKSKAVAKKNNYDLNGCMHDILSLLYYLRNVNYGNLAKKDVFKVSMFLDEKVYNLDVTYNGKRKNLKIKGGNKYNALHFSPNVIAGKQFEEGTKMEVYVSDDNNKIPVMVESPVSVGSVKAVLKSYKGLKHPFSARLN